MRKVFEVELNNRQAEFWKKDTNDYLDKEKTKNDYIKDVNLKHAEILKQQMNEKHKKGKYSY